jgi:hypothetical protein
MPRIHLQKSDAHRGSRKRPEVNRPAGHQRVAALEGEPALFQRCAKRGPGLLVELDAQWLMAGAVARAKRTDARRQPLVERVDRQRVVEADQLTGAAGNRAKGWNDLDRQVCGRLLE